MKKFAALLLAAVVMSLGFVSATSGAASNAAGVCPKAPYTGCVKTYIWGSHPASVVHLKKAKSRYISAKASVGAGNAAPRSAMKGSVTFVLRRNGHVMWNRHQPYPGAKTGGAVKAGHYVLTMTFHPRGGSVLKGSSRSYSFVVKK